MNFYCDFFDIVICADDTKLHKPNPEPLLKYLEKSFLNNNEVLYVGGTIYDMKAANSAGIDFAFAKWGNLSQELESKFAIEHPMDLLNHLKN